jgi:hypothetical protein
VESVSELGKNSEGTQLNSTTLQNPKTGVSCLVAELVVRNVRPTVPLDFLREPIVNLPGCWLAGL